MANTEDNREQPHNEPAEEPIRANEQEVAKDTSDLQGHHEQEDRTASPAHEVPTQATDPNDPPQLQTQISVDEPEEVSWGGSDIAYGPKEPDLLDAVFEKHTDKDLIDRLLGCAYGQALGDAYGLSTEFETREEVASAYPDQSTLIPFPDYIPTHHNRRWANGDWTDDTDQWILVLDTLLGSNGDVRDFARKLKNWIQKGFPELGDYGGMGLGANVSQVVRSPGYVDNPLTISEIVWEHGGRQAAPNGAVMRCSASALVYFRDLDKMRETTINMCKTTHCDPRCIASCLAVCLTVAYLLRDSSVGDDIEALVKRVQDETIEILADQFPAAQREQFLWHTDKARTLEELNLDESRSIGYTYKCLASGFYGLRSTESFEKTLNDLIRYGGDADTNGAVCGTMYGARHGYKKLPYDWLRATPYKKWFDKKIMHCLEQMDLNKTTTTPTNA